MATYRTALLVYLLCLDFQLTVLGTQLCKVHGMPFPHFVTWSLVLRMVRYLFWMREECRLVGVSVIFVLGRNMCKVDPREQFVQPIPRCTICFSQLCLETPLPP
uniref:Secreted protein n=1 Tax=Varanus komodoensis TaxID=61221 RepID=A0A8D2L7N1_VARKO